MSVLRSLLTAGVLASGLLWSLNGITATPAAQASDDRYEVTQQRNPDAACLDCHKPDTEGMHGKHASVINPNNKLPVTCTNCHGQPSPQHREGVKDVMRFNEPMYKVGEQNQRLYVLPFAGTVAKSVLATRCPRNQSGVRQLPFPASTARYDADVK